MVKEIGKELERAIGFDLFNASTMDIVSRITYSSFLMEEKEWMDICKKCKSDIDILSFIATKNECPSDVIDYMITFRNEKLNANLLKNENLNDNQLQKIFKNYSVISLTDIFEKSYKENTEPISQTAIRYMIKNDMLLNGLVFSFYKDREELSKIYKEYCDDEKITEYIANNIYINDSLRDMAFKTGSDWLSVREPTLFMRKNIYETEIEAIFEINPKSEEETQTIKNIKKDLLSQIKTNSTPDSCQIDFIERSKFLSKQQKEMFLRAMAENTTAENVIKRLIEEKYDGISDILYKRKDLPETKVKERLELNEKTIGKVFWKISDKKNPPDDIDRLIQETIALSHYMPLCEETYDHLLEMKNPVYDRQMTVMLYTPNKVLDELSKRKINISEHTEIICATAAFAIKAKDKFCFPRTQTFLNALTEYTEKHFGNHNLDKIVMYNMDKKEFENVVRILKDIKNEIKNPHISNFIKEYIKIITKTHKQEQEKLSADLIFKYDKEYKKILLRPYEDIRNIKAEKLQKQVVPLSKETKKELLDKIKKECQIDIENSANLYQKIDGYAQLYEITEKSIQREMEKGKEKEESERC